MAPMLLITLGLIFLVGQFFPAYGAGKTWPLLLVVVGVTKLFESFFWKSSGPSCQGGKSL